MFRLALLLYAVIGTSLAGIIMVAALTMGYDTTMPVIYSAAIGFALGLPISWYVAKQLSA
ncbi:CTP synthetase [Aliiroseovarius subalbicans]|uniref:CTP synthetase n=1 Tax=Aliiroseovarius subalbicans TaxID=2925840 RepID=UPI001F58846B|nr:CTP synthetase [Aliiroseovarius subalbicans]MCI2400404.1 CTP synthetase [Aliiroseovarius subalbicans]